MFLVESFQKNTEEPEALENSLIQEITEDTINHIKDNQIKSFECYYVDNSSFTNSLVLTINEMISKSKVTTKEPVSYTHLTLPTSDLV